MRIELRICAAATLFMSSLTLEAAQLTAQATCAFQRYVDQFERRLAVQHSRPGYAAIVDARGPDACSEICVERVSTETWETAAAVLHHWRAGMLVPHATAAEMLALLRDYGHFAVYYAPRVEWTRAAMVNGPHAVVEMRLKQQKPIAVVFDATYVVESALFAPDRGYSISRSIRLQEVERAGTSRERKLPPGDDDGFLWRLNSYWSFVQVPKGLFIECEAVSLTRDIPAGLGWLITPLLQTFPRESLLFTVDATGRALRERTHEEGR